MTLVFHNQSDSIAEEIDYLRRRFSECGFDDAHAVHAGPLVRREADYSALDLNGRKKLFRAQFNFMRRVEIGFKTFMFRKKEFGDDHDALVSCMSRDLGAYIRENLVFFQSFEHIVACFNVNFRRCFNAAI